MSSTSHKIDEESGDGEAVSENFVRLIGLSSGVMNLVALTFVGFTIFPEDGLVYGAIAGILAGVGSYFLIPWVILSQADTDDQAGISQGEAAGGIHPGALGGSLEAAGICMFAARFAVDDFVLGVGSGVAAGLVVFLVTSVLFSRVN